MKKFNVTIEGTADLLQNQFPMGESPSDTPVGSKVAKDYREEWRPKLYQLSDGTVYQQEAHIIGALVKAATGVKIAGRRGKTYKDPVNGGVFVEPAYIPHEHNVSEWEGADIMTGPAPAGYTKSVYIDRRPVRVQMARIMRLRPAMVKGWHLTFELQVLDDDFRTDVLKLILDTAGREVGIGDFRPRFGRFIVTHFEAV